MNTLKLILTIGLLSLHTTYGSDSSGPRSPQRPFSSSVSSFGSSNSNLNWNHNPYHYTDSCSHNSSPIEMQTMPRSLSVQSTISHTPNPKELDADGLQDIALDCDTVTSKIENSPLTFDKPVSLMTKEELQEAEKNVDRFNKDYCVIDIEDVTDTEPSCQDTTNKWYRTIDNKLAPFKGTLVVGAVLPMQMALYYTYGEQNLVENLLRVGIGYLAQDHVILRKVAKPFTTIGFGTAGASLWALNHLVIIPELGLNLPPLDTILLAAGAFSFLTYGCERPQPTEEAKKA